MIPIDFPQANKTLGPPRGVAGVDGLCVYCDGRQCLSCWQLTDEDRQRLIAGEPVWLFELFGETQPPVTLQVGNPFDSTEHSDSDSAALSDLGIKA